MVRRADKPDEPEPDLAAGRNAMVATPDPSRCAVLVIDMLNDFVDPAGALPIARAGEIVEPVARLVAEARALGMPVVWPCDRHSRDDRELLRFPPHGLAGTWGAEVIPRLSVGPGEHVVPKRRCSAFFGTGLDGLLRSLGVRQVILAGVATNFCVRATAQDACFLDYDVFVPVECVQATAPREQASSLSDIDAGYGDVVPLDALLAALRANAARSS